MGFIIRRNYISIQPKRAKRFKDKIRALTTRNNGLNVEAIVQQLNPVLRGWSNYFRMANCIETFRNFSPWVRGRLGMKKMKEWKSYKSLQKTLGRNSASPLLSKTLPNVWYDEIKRVDISKVETKILHHYYE